MHILFYFSVTYNFKEKVSTNIFIIFSFFNLLMLTNFQCS